MAETAVSRISDVSTYPALFRRVKETLLDGQRRIESEKVRTYWQTGRLIQTHILKNKDRADYGAEVFVRLAEDLGVSVSLLQRCVKFAAQYPDLQISAMSRNLTWSHYQELLSVSDDKQRLVLEETIDRNGLSIQELRARKKVERPEAEDVEEQPVKSRESLALLPIKGQLYTYQIQKRKVLGSGLSDLVVDLGFSIVHNVDARLLSSFSAGDIVESVPKEESFRFTRSSGRTVKDLYTYKTLVERVIDGDTLKVHIDLGFDVWVRQTLRLRGIDCPELATKDGEAAKAFVQSLLKEADEIVIRSSRSDKYDRYLADVFIPGSEGNDVFLNGLLVEKGLAERAHD